MTNKIRIRYSEEHEGLKEIEMLDVGDWIDLPSAETIEVKKGDYLQISLGVAMQLPKGFEAWVVPRSSTYKKWGLLQVNSPAIIDESYCGNDNIWGFHCIAMRDTKIEKGNRVCQFRIMQKMTTITQNLELEVVKDLGNENRGMSGHTGK